MSHAACTALPTGPDSPSIDVTFFPATATSGVTQERVATPSTCTVHAPQSAAPQPNFVPVIWRWSRSTQRSGVSGAASTVTVLPFSWIEGTRTSGTGVPGNRPGSGSRERAPTSGEVKNEEEHRVDASPRSRLAATC